MNPLSLLTFPFKLLWTIVIFPIGLIWNVFGFVIHVAWSIVSFPFSLGWNLLGNVAHAVVGTFMALIMLFIPHSSPEPSPDLSTTSTYIQAESSSSHEIKYEQTRSETMEKSNYNSVRKALSFSQIIDDTVSEFSLVSSTPLGTFFKITSKAVQGGIYLEDWLHTDKEIERRINDVLTSPKLVNATEYPELYSQFEKYIKTSLKSWVPDRDYPQIGYLPEEILYDKSLGEKEITKYWTEATQEDQEKYVALTFDELILNYEQVWDYLQALTQ